DRDMPPLAIQDVKRIVVHIRVRNLVLDAAAVQHIPHRHLRSALENEEQSFLNACLLAVLLRNLVFLFSVPTPSDRYVVGESPGTQTTPESSSHSHQMSIVEVVVGSIQLPPPDSKSRRTLCEPKIGIQHDPIHAIIGAVHEIRVHPAQSIWHTRSMLTNSMPPVAPH